VILFDGHLQPFACGPTKWNIYDAMFLEATKESLHNKLDETDFKLEHR
jgi:hypothetical protein